MSYLKFDIFKLYRFFHSGFCLKWTGATFSGFLFSLLFIEIGQRGELKTVDAMIGGTIIGLTQGLVLSQFFPNTWLWIFVNLMAWGLLAGSHIGVMGWVAPNSMFLNVRLMYGAIFGAMVGLWLGLWQWIILRNYFYQAWHWLWIMLISWGLGLSIGWGLGGILRSLTRLFIGEVIGLSVTWLIVGLITALGMIALSQTNLSID
ncbi:hypothetical protein [Gloeothece verrucosa]|uniref:Uncharacterized protein n=1 Tax=Gloeothece verrucosa (strain PCC 7822) TaxID=497965 RepID=E0U9U0_GLOV7|nr:hypothetical protein [Gloeothece verrucosa]ADN15010.1 conserved hypothetical protein [Gloeothece verrucosa PCC 7822]